MQVDEYRAAFDAIAWPEAIGPGEMVREFHEAFGLPMADGLSHPGDRAVQLRAALLEEEYGEYVDAIVLNRAVPLADALGDMVYVIYGTALTYGIDLDAVLAEIHRSNMSKLGEDGKPIYREDGKVMKGPNYSPPNLHPILYPI